MPIEHKGGTSGKAIFTRLLITNMANGFYQLLAFGDCLRANERGAVNAFPQI
jgi:hypothetical protein